MALQSVQEISLDPTQEHAFLSFFRSLPDKPASTIRVFDRNDFYTVHESDAVFASKEFFKTSGVIKYLGKEPNKIESVVLSKMNFESIIRDLLLVRHYRVEVYQNKGSNKSNDWKLEFKASPGNLVQFEDILFGNNDMSTCGGVISIKVINDNGNKVVGVAYLDNTLHEISVSEFTDNDKFSNLEALIVQLGPKECLLPSEKNADYTYVKQLTSRNGVLVTERKKSDFTGKSIVQDMNRLLNFKKGDLENSAALPGMDKHHAISSLAAIIKYLELLGNDDNFNQYKLSVFDLTRFVRLDGCAVKALNLLPVPGESAKTQSIFGLLNECRTAQGQRLLSRWVNQPLTDLNLIEERLDVVEIFISDHNMTSEIQSDHLKRFPDFQRIAKKFEKKKANLQDMFRIYQAISRLTNLISMLEQYSGEKEHVLNEMFCKPLNELGKQFNKFQKLAESTIDIEKANNGEYVVNPEFDEKLMELRTKLDNLEEKIENVFKKAARDLQLDPQKTIKLENNNQIGFHFRITKKEEKVLRNNKNYRMIQTNKGGVQFNNSALRDLNEEHLSVYGEYQEQQKSVVDAIMQVAMGYAEPMHELNDIISRLDVLLSFAFVAEKAPTSYVRPKLFSKGSGILKLTQARHPCLEVQDDVKFIPNDVYFEKDKTTFHIITGPNMGGKSTYIRSIGVNVVLAQIGSFIPCESAEISIVDSILARVGAGDSQMKGVSTFMVEMLETAAILRAATSDSLIIIDELGRGTSTFDGFGLAWAISEYISTKIKAFSLFATHFHELTALSDQVSTVNNLHVTALAANDKLTLLYKVNPGVCDQSFGIHVAELAQFPKHVIEFAKRKAKELEGYHDDYTQYDEKSAKKMKMEKQEADSIIEEFLRNVKALAIDQMSTVDVDKKIEKLKDEVRSKNNRYIQDLLNEV
uniref:DNA mismatch repair protein MSH2 n=1 Tax=Strigamia maritima TaxID=126957 RepID=T1IP55_STRMM